MQASVQVAENAYRTAQREQSIKIKVMRIHLFVLLFLLGLITVAQSQIQMKYITTPKDYYLKGDNISVLINLKTLPETCKDGLDRVKIYVSGLSILQQSDWKRISAATWQKQIRLEVVGGNRKDAKITILRKVDKENLFFQEHFKISN